MIRRLNGNDEHLLRLAYRWDGSRGEWFRAMDRVFNTGKEDDFVAKLHDRSHAFIGVFDGRLIGLLIIIMHAPGYHEGHLLAPRNADVIKLVAAYVTVIRDLLNLGMIEGWAWVAERNKPMRNICARIGLTHENVVMWKGAYKGRAIKWLKYSIRREVIAMREAA